METKFRDHPDALAVVAAGLERLKQLCTRFTGKGWTYEEGSKEKVEA
jgi:hypothetical protein